MDRTKPKIIVIAGPTASGKTAAAIDAARKFGGEIVSADSIQIYRHMDLGSAKPTLEQRSLVPHHMIDIRNPDEDFSVGDYMREGRRYVREILSRGRIPMVVGGTGLYIRALLGGIADIPPSDRDLRARLCDKERRDGRGALYKRLQHVDPVIAVGVQPNNLHRIIRALEVFELTGKRMSDIQKEHSFRDRPYQYIFICISPPRRVLYERIDKRVDSMINEGLIEEVYSLHEMGYSRDLKALQSLGYRHAGMIVWGEMDHADAIVLLKRDTRRYAKRQLTWFRSEPDALWCDPDARTEIDSMVGNFLGH